jgi:3-dehydroquinate synthase
MQESFDIKTSEGSYPVVITHGIIQEIASRHHDALYLIDSNLMKYTPLSASRCVWVDATEENKSLDRLSDVIVQFRGLGANRGTHIVAIGGGIVQDIATFCASIYMRGLGWTYVPSTMLSMADSCVGGKSSVNVAGYKNLVGNIYPPSEVLIDVELLATLPAEHVIGGLFEAVKICYAHSATAVLAFLDLSPSPTMAVLQLERVIHHALLCKKWFIETDEFDQSERLLLNFGHTFGHALEAGTNFKIPHGIAIGVGMLVAVRFSSQQKTLTDAGALRVKQLSDYVRSTILVNRDAIPCLSELVHLHLVMEKFENDKKHTSSHYRIVVPDEGGTLELASVTKNADSRKDLLGAFSAALADLSCFSVI